MSTTDLFFLVGFLLTVIVTLTASFFGFRWYQDRRDQQQAYLVASASDLLQQQQQSEALLKRLNFINATTIDAIKEIRDLKGVLLSAPIKSAITEAEKNVAALKKAYATKVEQVGGLHLYAQETPPAKSQQNGNNGNNNGNGKVPNKEASAKLITEAASAATESLGRGVTFTELWTAIKSRDTKIQKMDDFAKLSESQQKGLIDAALIILEASVS